MTPGPIGRRAVLAGAALLGATRLARAADPAAAAPIEALDQAILAAMKLGKKAPFMQRFNLLAPAVDRAFDLPGVLAASVGPRFASLPADQQTRLLDVFRRFTIASYAANFDEFNGEKLVVGANQRSVGQDLVVPTVLTPASGDPVSIDYVMHQGPQGWRAVDVLLSGSISQNAVKRSDFRSLISGPSAQPLIDSLQRKVGELSGGALS